MTSTLTFTIYQATAKGRVTDTTDYEAIGLDVSALNAVALGKIYYNNEVIYSFTDVSEPMIDLQSGATYFEFDLETNNNVGETPSSGTYEIRDYQVVVDIPILSVQGDITQPYESVIMTSTGASFVDEVTNGTEFSITSGVNQGDWIVDSAEGLSGMLFVSVASQMVTEGDVGAFMRIAYDSFDDASYSYSGCEEKTIAVDISADCDYGDFGSFTASDSTVYGTQTLVTSTMTIQYPSWVQESDSPRDPVTVTSSNRISRTITELATGTWTVSLSDTMTYTQTDGLVVIYVISTTQEFNVTCAGSLCCSMTCFEKLRQVHYAALNNNKGFSPYQKYMDNALSYYLEATQYKECGEMDSYRTAVANFEATLDSAGVCECSDCEETLQWVVNGSTETINAITELQAFQATIEAIPIDQLIYELTSPVTGTAPSELDAIAIPAKFITQDSVANQHGIFITIRGEGSGGTSGITLSNTTTSVDLFNSTGTQGAYEVEMSIVKGSSNNTAIHKTRFIHYDSPTLIVDTSTQIAWTWATINNLRIVQQNSGDSISEVTINGATVNP